MKPEDKDRLDQWLDRALQQYGNAQPRAGLERRVLANLAAEKNRLPGRPLRWWVLGTAATMAAVAIVVWLGSGANTRSKSPGNLANNTTSGTQKTSGGNTQSEVKRPVVETTVQRRTRPHCPKTVELSKSPRLSQFPSPQPLSEQEQLLVRYVKEFPQEAVMVAQEQAEFEKEIEELNRDNSAETHSDQHER